ncbi:LOW QUALITY PROTEIN: hypothetical protein AAY473_020693 [Plecturocebus cupreus]
MRHHVQLIFVFLVESGFRHVGQAGLELLPSSDPFASASQSVVITGVSRHTRWSLTLSPRLECHGAVLAHCNFCHPGSSDSPCLSLLTGITDMHHYTRIIFVFLVEMGFHHVGQVSLELLTSGDWPASASQSAGITHVSHHTWPHMYHSIVTAESQDVC